MALTGAASRCDVDLPSRFGKQIPVVDLHQPGAHWPSGWSAEHGAGSHIKLAAVAGARHRRTVELSARERTSHVSTGVIQAVQMSVRIHYVHLGSCHVEDAHLPRGDVLRITNPYEHDLRLQSSVLQQHDIGSTWNRRAERAQEIARPSPSIV